jgi:hypothetical protein
LVSGGFDANERWPAVVHKISARDSASGCHISEERVSGVSAVTAVSAATLVKGIIPKFDDEPNFGVNAAAAALTISMRVR